jgi:D,D-heptose 1,7-bisphosphate phosphatase
VDTNRITLESGVATALKILSGHGFLIIIITNQAGIALGRFQEKDIEPVRKKIEVLLWKENIHLDGFYYCPHHPYSALEEYRKDCDCRKPAAGMLLKAAADFNISLPESWMIGDILNDTEAGKKAGCLTILIDNGNETEWKLNEYRKPDFVAGNFIQAAEIILKHIGASGK